MPAVKEIASITSTYLETGKVDAGIELGTLLKDLAHGVLVAQVDLVEYEAAPELVGFVLEAGDLRHPVQRNAAAVGQIIQNHNGILGGRSEQTGDGVRSYVAASTGDEDARRRRGGSRFVGAHDTPANRQQYNAQPEK